jgi:hypothetical protein
MAHVATKTLRLNHYRVITAPSFGLGNEHSTAKPDQGRRTHSRPRGWTLGQSVLKKPTLMVWLPLRSRANTSSS